MLADNRTETAFDPARYLIDCRGRTLDCRPGHELGGHVMGVLNVTPDSFFDGGDFVTPSAALRHAEEMVAEGASLIDIGAESSRPRGKTYGEGASAVPVREELRRVLPVVEALVDRLPSALISVDTWKPEVADAVLDAGAHVINDVTGLRYTTETATVAASYGAPLVLMHSVGKPGEMPQRHEYDDVVRAVIASLHESVERASEAGVTDVLVDPGFGFGKTPRENLRLVNEVQDMLVLGRPVVLGVSRKSTIGAYLGSPDSPVPVSERLHGSLGAAAVGVLRGASVIRVHDVRATVDMLKIIGAALNSSAGHRSWSSDD